MNIREYTDADFDALQRIHTRCGFDYMLPPNLSGEDFISHRVVEDGTGIGMACFLRRTAEVYLISNPDWRNPAWRDQALRQVQVACNQDARKAGIVDVVAFVPPEIVKKFGRRLEKMGWSKSRPGWTSYSKGVS